MKKERTDPRLLEDPNYLAYKRQEVKLRKRFMGKHVAFVKGDLIAAGDDLHEILDFLHKNYPEDHAFVHQVLEKEPVYTVPSISRPRFGR